LSQQLPAVSTHGWLLFGSRFLSAPFLKDLLHQWSFAPAENALRTTTLKFLGWSLLKGSLVFVGHHTRSVKASVPVSNRYRYAD
jgi:hypothetical protein